MIERYSLPEMKSVWSDENKYRMWLEVEIAACEAWAAQGIIPSEDIDKLKNAEIDFDLLDQEMGKTRHDMPTFIKVVSEKLGPEARWIHLGLTTSDVWDTATSLQLVGSLDILDKKIKEFSDVLFNQALTYKNCIMLGRTHGINAEPITFGLKLAVWWSEISRHITRLHQAREMISVGKISGPVGTKATVSPEVEAITCSKLGLDVAHTSNQVIQRDRHAQFITTCALIAATLEKIATEIRRLQQTEIGEVSEPFPKGEPGSSSMPHKRNPELTERICGLSRLIRGNSLVAMENVALWGERDISHSSAERIILPDTCFALDYIIDRAIYVIKELNVNEERMGVNLSNSRGIYFSQRIMLELIERGMGRKEAYDVIHRCSMRSLEEGIDFPNLIMDLPEVQNLISLDDMSDIFDISFYIRYVDKIFESVGLVR